MTPVPGVTLSEKETRFVVAAPRAQAVWLCLFDGEIETRIAMMRDGEHWVAIRPGRLIGARYGFRADGDYAPERGLWFDPSKLLVDPYAIELDRAFQHDERLRSVGEDTAALVPRAIVQADLPVVAARAPSFQRGGLIYEVNVRGFSKLHRDVPEDLRGTVSAMAAPSVIAHLRKLNVSAVQFMPITAWIDERHLPPLGLSNAWGYNPIAMLALDPRLCPGGVAELRETVAALHAANISVFLDVVFNHTGESDFNGTTISLRGLDPDMYARGPDGALINDSGCGNTLDFSNVRVRELVGASLRHFVRHCGVDGFRFDLAPILAREPGFDAHAAMFAQIEADACLRDRVMIAEPWDIGPGGYQLGNFPARWLEWNDKFRDDVRRFWRGEGTPGALAMRVSGSSDVFGRDCRSVNFLAAHDGFTLADLVAYTQRHNEANGENNRDGHGENYTWNYGVEGPSADPDIIAGRQSDQRNLLTTLFASTGTIMLTAGDEFGRTQHGNNNAYAQHNAITWLDWTNRDLRLEAFTAALSQRRAERVSLFAALPASATWTGLDAAPMTPQDWDAADGAGFVLSAKETSDGGYTFKVDRVQRNAHLDFV